MVSHYSNTLDGHYCHYASYSHGNQPACLISVASFRGRDTERFGSQVRLLSKHLAIFCYLRPFLVIRLWG